MRVVSRDRCPECSKLGKDRSGDNLAIYEDGGEHCFSCGYHRGRIGYYHAPQSSTVPASYLPSDVSPEIDPRALQWLSQYFITYRDIINHKILWSEYRQRLIFPVNDCWQGRYFGDKDEPKWFTKGDIHNNLHLLGSGTTTCLVEDVVSGIRVGNCGSSMPIFGSLFHTHWIKRLLHVTENVLIWLDYDKRVEAQGIANRLRQFGFSARVIVTLDDPKLHTDEEITKILTQNT